MRRWSRFALPLLAALCIGAAGAPVPPVDPAEPMLGPATAPITVIEYASLTCPHCAAFEQAILPHLKTDWIETGKIRFVFRDTPRDSNDLLAFQFVHCSGDDRFWAFVDSLYRSQPAWVPAADPSAEFIRLGRLGGLDETQIRACLNNQALAKASAASAAAGHEAGVDFTPTFFLDGRKIQPATYGDWQQLLTAEAAQPAAGQP